MCPIKPLIINIVYLDAILIFLDYWGSSIVILYIKSVDMGKKS